MTQELFALRKIGISFKTNLLNDYHIKIPSVRVAAKNDVHKNPSTFRPSLGIFFEEIFIFQQKDPGLEFLVLLFQDKRTRIILANRQRRFADSNQNIKAIRQKDPGLEFLVLLFQDKRTRNFLANRQRRFADSNQNIKGMRQKDPVLIFWFFCIKAKEQETFQQNNNGVSPILIKHQ